MGTRSLVSPKIKTEVSATVKNLMSTTASVAAQATMRLLDDQTLTDGVSEGQANRIWYFDGTIADGGDRVIDVYDFGSLDAGAGLGLDALGQALALLEIVAVFIKNNNDAGTAGILEVTPNPTNGWTPIGTHTAATGGGLRAQGTLLKTQPGDPGLVVTDGSSHRMLLAANGGSVDYQVIIVGRHDTDESSSSSLSSSASSSSSSVSSQSSSSSASTSSSSSSISTSSSSSNSSSSSSSSSVSTSSSSSSSSSQSSISTSSNSSSSSSSSSSSAT